MSLRKLPRPVSDYGTLEAAVQSTRYDRMPGMLNGQSGEYEVTTPLDGREIPEVVFVPNPADNNFYAHRLNERDFTLGIVTVMSRHRVG